MNYPAFDHTIEHVYKAAEGLDTWPHALQLVAEGFDGLGAQFACVNNKTGVWTDSQTNTGWPAELGLEYVKKYHAVDPRIPLLMKRGVGEWLYCQDEFGDAASDMEYYRDLLIPYGGRYSATMKVADERDETILLGLTSRIQTGPFNDEQRDYINRIGGHLRQAIVMYRRYRALQSDAAVGNTLIVRIPKPIFVIRPDRTVVTKNEAATALLDEADSPFRLHQGQLAMNHVHLVQPFAAAIERLKNGGVDEPDQFISLGTELRKKWLAVGVAFFSHTPVHKALAHMNNLLVTVYPRAVARAVEPSILQAALSLTRAEAKLASLIFAGETVRDAAAKMGVAETTAKTHLMSVFNKTGVAKQSELVRLVASLISN